MNERITYSGKHCAACGHPAPDCCAVNNAECMGPVDEHHIKTRGAVRKDKKELLVNKIYLCRKHHTDVDNLGRWTFALRNGLLPEFIDALGSVKFEQWLATQTEEIKNEVKSAIENKSEVEHG